MRYKGRLAARKAFLDLVAKGAPLPDHLVKQAVSVPCFLKKAVSDALAREGYEVHIAPFEADAQMASFARSGFVDHVWTTDTDLLVYRVPSLLLATPGKGTTI